MRSRFQGTANILKFNWHFYVISITFIIICLYINFAIYNQYSFLLSIVLGLAGLSIAASVLVSYYVYDYSDLYHMQWAEELNRLNLQTILNINAGFDETSGLLEAKFPKAALHILDFYNAEKHTEVSIKRARKAYPPDPRTQTITTTALPYGSESVDAIFLTLAAHEIRDNAERIAFFIEMNRVLKTEGKVYVTEHLRDLPNFLAFNIGFFHFHSESTWIQTFKNGGFTIQSKAKTTPFITTYILVKYGITS